MDDPLVIVNAAIDQHTKMVKQMKGVPGVDVLPYELYMSSHLSNRLCILHRDASFSFFGSVGQLKTL
jgi:hypothetical protein